MSREEFFGKLAGLDEHRLRHAHGFGRFAVLAAPQLVRWDSRYGWTRSGWGSIARKETRLAGVLARALEAPDMWVTFADRYLDALDHADGGRNLQLDQRTWDLAEWHDLLMDRLPDYDADDRLDRLARHPALGGPELTFFQAKLARQRRSRAQSPARARVPCPASRPRRVPAARGRDRRPPAGPHSADHGRTARQALRSR